MCFLKLLNNFVTSSWHLLLMLFHCWSHSTLKCGLPLHSSDRLFSAQALSKYITQRVQKTLFCFSVKVSKKIWDKDQTKHLGGKVCAGREWPWSVSEEGKKRTLVMLIKKDGVKRKGRKIKWSWKKVEQKLVLGAKQKKWKQGAQKTLHDTHTALVWLHVWK